MIPESTGTNTARWNKKGKHNRICSWGIQFHWKIEHTPLSFPTGRVRKRGVSLNFHLWQLKPWGVSVHIACRWCVSWLVEIAPMVEHLWETHGMFRRGILTGYSNRPPLRHDTFQPKWGFFMAIFIYCQTCDVLRNTKINKTCLSAKKLLLIDE